MRMKRSLERQAVEKIDPNHTIYIQISGEERVKSSEVLVDEAEPVHSYAPAKTFSLLSDIIE